MTSPPIAQVRSVLFAALGLSACRAGSPEAASSSAPQAATTLVVASAQSASPEPPPRAQVGFVSDGVGTGHRVSGETCAAFTVERGESRGHRCATDGDCDASSACHCAEDGRGACVPARCRNDSECATIPTAAAVPECALVRVISGCGSDTTPGFACRTTQDTCHKDADCTDPDVCLGDTFRGGLHCGHNSCMKGRPLYVDDRPQTAAIRDGDRWTAEGWNFDLGDLSAEARAAFAETAVRDALDEHASIAAFARTLVELLALGAPPALISETQAALADEIRHARLCFALARAAGAHVEPGPFPEALTAFAAPEALVGSLARSVFRGGCLGETHAAVDAATRAQEARGAELRAFYREIADDEARHAALAWKTLRWLHAREPGVVAGIVREELGLVAGSEGSPASQTRASSVLRALVLPLVGEFLAA